ncbi:MULTISPECIES: hypothetical protein [unclassified Bacillus cereus group]|uniref:hypothetical protein n=1 Tax=unclassified Bacillus cereus group TaxID=2750818 RepID=UPI00027A2B4E|nr:MULTISPECIES: hypothetical protein [unclassified Bacillus cereus group]EJR51887.1 hypothetical protein IIK_00429 [Bacillus cereus VD102]MDA2734502.1 hypothetical protein [Bacillus cereus group sp. Bc015]
MAKRPTMKQLQTNDRQQDERLTRVEQRLKNLERREIINLLKEKNIPGGSKYRYTYEEITKLVDASPSVVARIAKEEGISRRLYRAL